MGRLKEQSRPKISNEKITGSLQAESRKIAFSFQHVTTNNRYNWNFFKKRIRDELQAHNDLLERLKELSNETWLSLFEKPKKSGAETLPRTMLKFDPDRSIYEERVNEDQFISIRFASQQYRLLGMRKKNSSTFFIIGYDFDFSAYDHE